MLIRLLKPRDQRKWLRLGPGLWPECSKNRRIRIRSRRSLTHLKTVTGLEVPTFPASSTARAISVCAPLPALPALQVKTAVGEVLLA